MRAGGSCSGENPVYTVIMGRERKKRLMAMVHDMVHVMEKLLIA